MSRSPVAAGVLVLGMAAASPTPAMGQDRESCQIQVSVVRQPDSGEEPRSNMVAIPEAPGRYALHLGGGIVSGRCGDAVMTGDSAVHLEHLAEALMVGSVRYRDTTRVLDAQRVTYFGFRDRVVAEGDVRLERLANGATLEGPRVEFLRTPLRGSRTVATGRPRMTVPTGSPGSEPFEVDADVAEFEGEERAFARGDVRVHRSDLDATADSARFDAGGVGVLYGRPVVVGEGFTLTGDSVMASFEADDLREVRAFGDAAAAGEDFELQSELVTARLVGGEIERLWAFGAGRSLAASGRFQLAGDSLDFAFTTGVLDSIAAVGAATSVETEPHVPGTPLTETDLGVEPGANWVAGHTVRAFFTVDGEGQDAGVAGGPKPERLLAEGEARSYYAAVRDSIRSRDPSRNYLLGRTIEILFRDGKPSEVRARDAIGIYLEPSQEGGGG